MPEQTTPPVAHDEGTTTASADDAPVADREPRSFTDVGVDPALAEKLAAKGIHSPFPIQELTLPIATKGHDVIGQARTGTGKTLAFGLALLGRIHPGGGTQALVIVPTRELCIQVADELQIGTARGLRVIAVYGGVGYEEQETAFREGHEVVVGTPGRLLDHVNKRNLRLDGVTELVLDEADEMLDMGFLPDVERLIEACNDDRHGMLFSATMPTDVVKLARRYLDHPTFMRADHEVIQTAPNVEQHFFQVHRMDKPRVLARILQSPDRGGVYVFVRTKHMADRLVRELEDLATPAIAIHGDLRQATREKNLDKFRDGSATVLVATEVAARGLDVENVSHVVNYDCPDDEKMYLHRIGRTARAGGKGVAITFAEFNEIDRLNVVRKKLGALENPIEAVFSTSDELTERFDLPEERPWDSHVAATKAGTRTDRRDEGGRNGGDRGGRKGGDRGGRKGGDRGDSKGGDRGGRKGDRPRGGDRDGGRSDRSRADGSATETARPDETVTDTAPAADARGSDGRDAGPSDVRPRARRKGSTDGRPKSSRSSEGRGNDRDASRARHDRTEGRDDDAGADRSRGGDRSRDDRDGGTRVRTRTRTRTRDAGQDGGADRGDDRDGRTRGGDRPDGEGRAAGEGRTRSDAGGGRTRARARGRDGAEGSSRGGEDARRRDGGEGRTRGGGGDAGGGDRDRGGRSQNQGDRGGRGGGQGGNRGGGGKGGRGGRGRNDERGGKGGRDGGGRSGGRGSRDQDPTVATARRGEEARGDGDPMLARRVKVEHLP